MGLRWFAGLLLLATASGQEAWELVDLERAVMGSKVLELNEESLAQATQEHALMVVWFYAPWCKQCKLVRDSFEQAASSGVEGVTFGRIDCTKYPNVKQAYEIFSYPAFKAIRGDRHRWVYTPKQRTGQMITAAAAAEAALGAFPYRLLHSADDLRSAVFEQLTERGGDPGEKDPGFFAGVGEAAVIALLSHADAPSANAYARLAAGVDIRASPMPFLAVTDATLLQGLQETGVIAGNGVDQAPDSIVVLREDAKTKFWYVAGTAPLSMDGASLDARVKGLRIPPVVDFASDMYWAKRAATLTHVKVHGMLFVTTAHHQASLEAELLSASGGFVAGELVFFLMDVEREPGLLGLFKKYGGGGAADTPKLVFLDQRIQDTNRQVPYAGELKAGAIRSFLVEKGLQVEQEEKAKDEL